MAIAPADVTVLDTYSETANQAVYEGDVKTFAADTLYVLIVGSVDLTTSAKPTGIVTTGVAWVEEESIVSSDTHETAYRAVPTANTSSTTEVTFDSAQENCYWNIFKVVNADTTGVNGANAVVQAESASGIGTSFSHTLTNPVTTSGNLVLTNIFSKGSPGWIVGTGQTALTTTGPARGFAQYNLDDVVAITATTTFEIFKVGIVLEISGASAPVLTLPTLAAESTTELSGTVTCSSSGDDLYWYISTSAVAPSSTDLKAGTGAVAFSSPAETISASGLQTIASFGTSFDPATSYYVYYLAVDPSGDSAIVSAGPVTTGGAVTLHTLELIDKTTVVTDVAGFTIGERYEIIEQGTPATDFTAIGAADNNPGTVFTATGTGSGDGGSAYHIIPCVCESTDFALGVTAELWPAGVEENKEVATSVEAIDTANTANPQYNITFTATPDSGSSDVVNIIYDATVGNIKSVTGGIALASGSFSDATNTC